MGSWIGIVIEVLVFLGGVITVYINGRLNAQKLENRVSNLEDDLDAHINKQQPLCLQSFEKIKLDIASIKQREEYETEIVGKILQPILEKFATEMKQYTDFKIDTIQKEIQVYTADNHEIKEGIKQLLIELKNETNRKNKRA